MSCLVTRPPSPVPLICDTSTLCSAANRATTGDSRVAFAGCCSTVGDGVGKDVISLPRSRWRAGVGAACSALADVGVASAAFATVVGASLGSSPGAPITAISVPTLIVSPSGTSTSSRVPSAGDGISEFTLSVMISTSGSYFATLSPFADRALGHRLAQLRHCDIRGHDMLQCVMRNVYLRIPHHALRISILPISASPRESSRCSAAATLPARGCAASRAHPASPGA